MANTYELRYAVSVTPVENVEDTSGTRLIPAIDNAVNKTLGGGGTISSGVITGYTSGSPNYTGSSISPGGDSVFIKNSGLTMADTTVKTTDPVSLSVGGIVIAILQTGEAIFLPKCSATITLSTSTVALEYIYS